MGRIIPPNYNATLETISIGEQRVFNAISEIVNNEDWIVLHSLSLTGHTKHPYGEIDFVVLSPSFGLLILEVKGGALSCRNGMWYVTSFSGKEDQLRTSPFTQANGNMHSLRNHIIRHFGKKSPEAVIPFHWAVVFPETGRFPLGISAQQWQVCFREDFKHDFRGYLIRSTENSLKELESYNLFQHGELPSQGVINSIVRYLRPEFEQYPNFGKELENTDLELLRLTSEQYDALDALEENPRCLFRGGAGVGKTFIALEGFRRAIRAGRSTLLLTYSSLVSTWLRHLLRTETIPQGSAVLSIVELVNEGQHSPLDILIERKWIAERLFRLSDLSDSPQFDELIIDEGQDIIQENFLLGIDSLVKGGLKNGYWKIFGDFEKQAVYEDLPENQIMLLSKMATDFSRCLLRQNCRNTGNIFDYLIPLSGFNPAAMKRNHFPGEQVDYFFYENRDELVAFLQVEIKALNARKAGLSNITILSPLPFTNSVVSRLQPYKIYDVSSNPDWFIKKDGLSFADIRSFKGLENNIIFITEIEDISDLSRKLLYTGISRAKQKLFLCLPLTMFTDFMNIFLPSIQNKSFVK